MRRSEAESNVSGPFDETVDATAPWHRRRRRGDPSVCRLRLVEGTDHELTSETQQLLRSRLRIASLMLFLALAVFLVWHVATFGSSEASSGALLTAHAVVTLLLGLCAASLCRRCPMSHRVLRMKELLVFAAPAVYLLFWDYHYIKAFAAQHGVLPFAEGMWLMLLFIYALFIPNTWQRAAVVIGSFASAPIVLTLVLFFADQHCRACANADAMYVSQLVLKLLVGAVISVVAVHTIGTLRRQAHEARQLGQYKLRRRIGSGGMGEVYLAEHQLMKRPCAIKVIRPEKAGDPRVLARFEREVRTSAKLSHWNNIDVFDYGHTDDGTFYYVMEFLPGLNLKQLVDRFGPLPPERVIYLLVQICDALNEAHGIGLIHRDIKPANIFTAERGGLYDVAKLLDFGLAKPQLEPGAVRLTMDGTISGSPLYMSPEQATGDDTTDERSDIYALGAVAYFTLTGQPPFDDDNPMKVLIAHVNQAPTPPSEINPQVPADLEMVVMRCLAKEREDRYQSAAELRAALEACEAAGRWTRQTAARWWQQHMKQPGGSTTEAVGSL